MVRIRRGSLLRSTLLVQISRANSAVDALVNSLVLTIDMRIEGKVALVTGAGAGIGHTIALALGHKGAAVIIDDVDAGAGKAAVREIERAGGRAVFVRADVGSEAELRSMFDFARTTFRGLDILVNNAGFYLDAPFFPEAKPKRWNRVVDVYLRAVMLATQLGIDGMKRRGGGAILNIASMAGFGYSAHDLPEYAASKAAVGTLHLLSRAAEGKAGDQGKLRLPRMDGDKSRTPNARAHAPEAACFPRS